MSANTAGEGVEMPTEEMDLPTLARQDPLVFISRKWRAVGSSLTTAEIVHLLERFVVTTIPHEFLLRSHAGSAIEQRISRVQAIRLRAAATLHLPDRESILRACRDLPLTRKAGNWTVPVMPCVATLVMVACTLDPASKESRALLAHVRAMLATVLDPWLAAQHVRTVAHGVHAHSHPGAIDAIERVVARVLERDVTPPSTYKAWLAIIHGRLSNSR